MADNSQAQAVTSGGTTFADDDIGGVKFPRNKIVHGADGVNDGDVSTANPFPIRLYVGTTTCNLGSGVATGALRTTLASDDPAVTALQLIDNAVSGAGFNITQMNGVNVSMGNGASGTGVQRVTLADDSTGTVVLAAGTAGIGKLTANSGVIIGAVEIAAAQTLATVTTVGTVSSVSAIIPGTGATNLGKAIDTPTGATDTGVLLLATRDDALTTLTPADGDNVQLRVDENGSLWVNLGGLSVYTTDVAAPASPVGLAGLHVRDDALSTLAQAEGDWVPSRTNSLGAIWVTNDGIFTDDDTFTVGTSKVAAVGFLVDETATDSADEGDIVIARATADRKQRVVAELDSTSIRGGATARTPTFAVVSAASAGDNTLVAAAGGSLKIRVLQLVLVATGGANTVALESGAGGTALTGDMDLVADGQLILPFSPVGWFETAANTLLNLELSAATSVTGVIGYITVD